jgi:hypothetical protein
LSWALFAVNTVIQFPFLIRFGYTRVNILTTILPWMVVAVVIEKTHLTMPSIQSWLLFIGVAGAAALMAPAPWP